MWWYTWESLGYTRYVLCRTILCRMGDFVGKLGHECFLPHSPLLSLSSSSSSFFSPLSPPPLLCPPPLHSLPLPYVPLSSSLSSPFSLLFLLLLFLSIPPPIPSSFSSSSSSSPFPQERNFTIAFGAAEEAGIPSLLVS